ncbi:cysteine desulfurase-like protein [Peribacillus kribbensis]|uniref:cysteine desulfurase-like protein n=1 Tax=Peribacillus kribbensis TaxID=356658 RepID=UPI00041B415D|nr:cysteine desulfurase-like protein [Peribacillus kribbensis]
MNHTSAVYPISKVREQFPALRRKYHEKPAAYFDGPGGSQTVNTAIQAITRYMENGGANLHGAFPSSVETEHIIRESKEAVGDFLNVDPREVAFGANMTTLAFAIARALSRNWEKGDEIVVTELDHRANVDPWLSAAEERGLTIRWIPVDPEKLTLDLSDLDTIINRKTRLVAAGLASNAVGTIAPIQTIAARARKAGALMAVDAVHAAPHIPIDRDELDADILLCSSYKFFGPHIGIAAIRENIFKDLQPYKLEPAPSCYPDKLETGTQNHEGIAGIQPAIAFFEQMGTGSTRRERIVSGIRQIEEHEGALADMIRDALGGMEPINLYQAGADIQKTPTIAFTVEGYEPREVCRILAEQHAIFIADGDFYATTLADKLGINRSGGWIRAGLAPYNSEEEAERFIAAIQSL